MARSNDPIAKLYEHRRSYPDAKPHDRFPKPQDAARYHDHREIQANQFPEDRHGPGYDGDHRNDWVRGRGESAEGKPGYDRGQSYKRANKGDDWRSGSDHRLTNRKPFPKPEKNRP